MASLDTLAECLRSAPNVVEKLGIASAFAPALPVSAGIELGDDAAAIRDGDGFLLLAAEGMIEGFVARDPWFAGYSAVMVNLSDIAAMGGRAIAVVDVIWSDPAHPAREAVWSGLCAASERYGVPIVGGHTARLAAGRTPMVAAAVVGRADRRLISGAAARPGDDLLAAMDLRGAYRDAGTNFWNASTGAPAGRVRGDLGLLPELAESDLVDAGRDISNGGIVGTLAMLLAASGCGGTLELDSLPAPAGVERSRWLVTFPSYGFLLAVRPERTAAVRARFEARGLACTRAGGIDGGRELALTSGGERATVCRIGEWSAHPASSL